ncbi:hypothetical protein OG215_36535 (plasmid) [Streptomyces globisporus]|uniref:hypothetical protein n=1 Tax=Streptomyces globisporus TaxID=1908 RepID=UPI002F90BB69|nr:hypothetical protein OG215_36535 [Streptomyces globisporus]
MADPQTPAPDLAQALAALRSPDQYFLQDAQSDAELAQQLAHFDALGRGVADALNSRDIEGGGWTHSITPARWGNVRVEHRDGMHFEFKHHGSYRKGVAGRRLEVKTGYPYGYSGWRAEPITVSMDRDPHAIAIDVLRRLMPSYRATLESGLDEARRSEAQRRARIEVNRLIEQVVPGVHGIGGLDPRSAPDRDTSYWPGSAHVPEGQDALPVGGRVILSPDASEVELRLRKVPPALALELLEYLRQRNVVAGQEHRPLPRTRVIVGELEVGGGGQDASAAGGRAERRS